MESDCDEGCLCCVPIYDGRRAICSIDNINNEKIMMKMVVMIKSTRKHKPFSADITKQVAD